MTYIVERSTCFYVVTYDGLDPLTGRERRRCIPIGHDRSESRSRQCCGAGDARSPHIRAA
jgi:hypothetical protein